MNKEDIEVVDLEYKQFILNPEVGMDIYKSILNLIQKSNCGFNHKELLNNGKNSFVSNISSNILNMLAVLDKRSILTLKGNNKEEKYKILINIIFEYLWKGKKILITSNNLITLNEIRNYLPKLFINKEKFMENDIYLKELELSKTFRQYYQVSEKIINTEKKENAVFEYNGKKLRTWQLSKWVNNNKSQYGWIEDFVGMKDEQPLTDAKFSKLIYLLSNISREDYFDFYDSEEILDVLPPQEEIVTKIKRYEELKTSSEELNLYFNQWNVDLNMTYDYKKINYDLKNIREYLSNINEEWVLNLLKLTLEKEKIRESINQFILSINYLTIKNNKLEREIKGHIFDTPKNIEEEILLKEVVKALREFKVKGKINKLYRITHSKYSYIDEKCEVDGKKIEKEKDFELLNLYLENQCLKNKLLLLWNNNSIEFAFEKFKELDNETLNKIKENISKFSDILEVSKLINNIKPYIEGSKCEEKINWTNHKCYSKLSLSYKVLSEIREFEDLKIYRENLINIMSRYNSLRRLAQLLKNDHIEAFKEEYKKIERLKSIKNTIKDIRKLTIPIKDKCPLLMKKILWEEDRINMLERYKNFSKAWTWRKFYEYIMECDKENLNSLESELEKYQEKITAIKSQLIYNKNFKDTNPLCIAAINELCNCKYEEKIQFDLVILLDAEYICLKDIKILLNANKGLIVNISDNKEDIKKIYDRKINNNVFDFSRRIFPFIEIEDKYSSFKFKWESLHQNEDLNINTSIFRKDVYELLIENGFSVKINEDNNFCIDFFVEKNKQKFIIQLDGNKNFYNDLWNERYKAKKYFNTLGWNTILVRGSEFYNNPNQALKEIFQVKGTYVINKGIA